MARPVKNHEQKFFKEVVWLLDRKAELGKEYSTRDYVHNLSFGWLDDIVYGAANTGGKTSGGKMNIGTRNVYWAMRFPEINAEQYVTDLRSLRQAQRLCASATCAVQGVEHYLMTHPTVLQAVQEQVKLMELEAARFKAGELYAPVEPLQPIPDDIDALRRAGDYYAYGVAVRAFRQGNAQ